jgi:type I restriction enzyme S subunit
LTWSNHATADLISAGILEIGDGYRAKNSEMAETGVPFVRAGDVDGRVNTAGTDLLSETSVEKAGRKRSMPGDVVMTTKGTIGRLAFVKSGDPDFIYSPQLCFWRSLNAEVIDPRWLFFAMRSQEMLNQISWSAGQTDMAPYVSLTDQRTAFKITLPTIEEQRAIAATLGALDDKIELNRKTAATLEEMARALFRSWFIDFDPVWAKLEGRAPAHMDAATAALFPDRFGEDGLPEGWAVVTINSVCERIFSGGTPKTDEASFWGGSVPWLSSGETRQNFIFQTEKTITELGIERSSTRLARRGAVVVASAGQGKTRGQTSYLGLESYINQSVIACEAKNESVSDHFLYCDLARRYEEFRSISDANSSRGSLTTKLLGGLETILPTAQVVRAFDILTTPHIERILGLVMENRALADLRDTLLPKLMSGELRVGDARQQVEEVA